MTVAYTWAHPSVDVMMVRRVLLSDRPPYVMTFHFSSQTDMEQATQLDYLGQLLAHQRTVPSAALSGIAGSLRLPATMPQRGVGLTITPAQGAGSQGMIQVVCNRTPFTLMDALFETTAHSGLRTVAGMMLCGYSASLWLPRFITSDQPVVTPSHWRHNERDDLDIYNAVSPSDMLEYISLLDTMHPKIDIMRNVLYTRGVVEKPSWRVVYAKRKQQQNRQRR